MERTASTSPGRAPKVKRFSACKMRLSSSICGGRLAFLFFDFLSAEKRKTVEIRVATISKANALRDCDISSQAASWSKGILTLNSRKVAVRGGNGHLDKKWPIPRIQRLASALASRGLQADVRTAMNS